MRNVYPRLTATGIARRVTSKRITAVGRERAMRQAQAADRLIADGRSAGILAGDPVILKDNVVYRDYPETCVRRLICRR